MSKVGERRLLRNGSRPVLAAAGLALALASPSGSLAQGGPAGGAGPGERDAEGGLDLPVASVSRREERSSEAPAAVFVLTGEDLRALGIRTLAEALATVPGLFTYEDARWTSVGVRGVGTLADGGKRILLLLDGQPIGDALGAGPSWVGRELPVPLRAIRRIEVVKGPAGRALGPAAFLASVNLVTVAPGRDAIGAAASVEGRSGEAAGGALEASLERGGGRGGAAVHASAFTDGGTDRVFPEWSYLPPPQQVPGDVARDVDGASGASLLVRASGGGLDAAAACGAFARRMPSAPWESLKGDRRTRATARACQARLAALRRVSPGWEIGGRVGYDGREREDRHAYDPWPGSLGLLHYRAHDRWISGELEARWSAGDGVAHLSVGATPAAHWTLQHAFTEGAPSLLDDPRDGVGLGPVRKDFWTVDAWFLGDAELVPGLRLHGGATLHAHELFGERLSVKVAAVWRPAGADAVKLVYAEGLRVPTVAEAFHEDGIRFLPGPDLEPELVRSGEAIYERRIGGVAAVTASAFLSRFDDLIGEVTVNVPGGERRQSANGGHRYVAGLEATLSLRWREFLRAWGGLSVHRASEDGVANAPTFTAAASLATRWPWRPLQLAVRASGVSEREKDPATVLFGQRTAVPGQVVLGAAATFEPPGLPGLSVEVSASNLLDARVLHPATAEVPPLSELEETGRTVWAGIRWTR